jgi:hypothetical protein
MSSNLNRPAELGTKPRTRSREYLAPYTMRPATGNQTVAIRARRIFLISPANIHGIRGSQIMSDGMQSGMAERLRNQGVPLGEIFSFISGLYFRGKLAYAEKFAKVAGNVQAAYVITASAGLVPFETLVTLDQLRELSTGAVDPINKRYRGPLDRDSTALRELVGTDCQVVLLGSIATPKYVEPLLESFGEQLFFPAEFVGRGDMSRGGLMLRCVSTGVQLTYVPLATAARHGSRPPKLRRLPQVRQSLPAVGLSNSFSINNRNELRKSLTGIRDERLPDLSGSQALFFRS